MSIIVKSSFRGLSFVNCSVKMMMSFLFSQQLVSEVDTTTNAWIAGCFVGLLPNDFKVGDNRYHGYGRHLNRPLTPGQLYRVFVRAYTAENVSLIRYNH